MSTKKGGTKFSRGFSLLEITLVLVIVGAVAIALANMLKWRAQSESVDTVVDVEAHEISILMSAMEKWASANYSSWTANAVQTVSVATLNSGGYLPANFALRNSAQGTTPLFEQYFMRAWKSSTDNLPRILVTETGTPDPGRLARYGLTQNSVDIQSLKQRVSQAVQKLNGLPAGVINAGATSVTGNYGSFLEDVSTAYATASTFGDSAQLYGFPELGVVNGGTGGTNNNPGSKWQYCNMYSPTQTNTKDGSGNYQYVDSTCPSGWTSLTKTPFCGQFNTYFTPQYSVYGTAVGDVVLGNTTNQQSVTLKSGLQACEDTVNHSGCILKSGVWYEYTYSTVYNYQTGVQELLNGATINTDNACQVGFNHTCLDSNSIPYVCVTVTKATDTMAAYYIDMGQTVPAFSDQLCCLAAQ